MSDSRLSQTDYSPTAWEDSTWEIVGEYENRKTFDAVEFQVVRTHAFTADPMFADYGGIAQAGAEKRSHGGDPARRRAEQAVAEPFDLPPGTVLLTESELSDRLAAAAEEGRQAAQIQFDQQMQAHSASAEERYSAILHDLALQLREQIELVERRALDLSLEITDRLIGAAVEVNPEYVIDIIRRGLAQVGGAVIRSVRVSPGDMEFLGLTNLGKVFKDFDGTWEFVADDTVKAGCIVITSAGEIDFQIDRAFERVRDGIVKMAVS
jgi:flagellar biosynthesis/type III secretory pathway protein FliH